MALDRYVEGMQLARLCLALPLFWLACGDSNDEPTPNRSGGSSSGESPGETGSSGAAASSGSAPGVSSSSGAAMSSGATTSSSSGAAVDRCEAAAQRAEAHYTECGIGFAVLDGGAPPPCTEDRAASGEALADCLAEVSCAALKGDADATDQDRYFECLSL